MHGHKSTRFSVIALRYADKYRISLAKSFTSIHILFDINSDKNE